MQSVLHFHCDDSWVVLLVTICSSSAVQIWSCSFTHLPSELIWRFRCGSHRYNWETDLLKDDFGACNTIIIIYVNWMYGIFSVGKFTQVIYLGIIWDTCTLLEYFHFMLLHTLTWLEILYFLLHYIYLTAFVASYFSDEDLTQWIISQVFKIHNVKDFKFQKSENIFVYQNFFLLSSPVLMTPQIYLVTFWRGLTPRLGTTWLN